MCWTVNEIKKGVWHVDESGLNAMYVVKGSKMSAVIDAGTGIGDFKGLVESLVDNPYVVLITHGHVDHAGGCGQFIEAYINERDYQAALNIKVEDRERYLKNMESAGAVAPGSLSIAEELKNDKKPEFRFMKEGDIFDLGDKKLVIYEMTGHTAGSVCILDEEERILFSGDSVNDLKLICVSAMDREALLKEWYEAGKRIFARKDSFDICGGGHCLIPIEKAEETLTCGEMILSGELQAKVEKVHFFHAPFYKYKDSRLYNGDFAALHSEDK